MSAKKTRENSVFSCCGEGMNFFVPNNNTDELYLRLAALFSAPDDDSRFVQPTATRIPTGSLCPPGDPSGAGFFQRVFHTDL